MAGCLLAAVLLAAPSPALSGTKVRFSTSLGPIDVELTDSLTPLTVQNFLSYVNDHVWDNTFIHRSEPTFVIQGGGYLAETNVPHVTQKAPVKNEFQRGTTLSNVRGTISMAKLGEQPDSATSEWFFNLADNNDPTNPNSLDNQNGGFTAFGSVINGSMTVVDGIAALPRVNLGGDPFAKLPVQNYVQGNLVTFDNLVKVNYVALLQSAFQNPTNIFDVNKSNSISPQDVLAIIDLLNTTSGGIRKLGITYDGGLYYDVTGDSRVTPQDVLAIIDEINQQGTTVLLVEQNAAQALKRADSAHILETGEIVRSGTGAELAGDDAVKAAYLGGDV